MHIMLPSLWEMCLVFTFLSDLLEELTKNRVNTLAVISHVTMEKPLVN